MKSMFSECVPNVRFVEEERCWFYINVNGGQFLLISVPRVVSGRLLCRHTTCLELHLRLGTCLVTEYDPCDRGESP